ncbi:ATP-binding cassette domain-containing protein [Candidatus Thorarchaeota archaeon]|jgi:oligopeptide/dipeptide ABC transporter ATP-binding protein|nr:MAG: ATP-binding cassette domain-containing protein [Candidatus Thorarchaeota archaeon]
MSSDDVVLETRDLKKWFSVRGGLLSGLISSAPKEYVKAVDGISIEVKRGEVFAVVGESGCGKTTLARLILRLEEPTDGDIWLDGVKVSSMPQHEFREYRTRIQMIFQDPYGSLNSSMRIGDIVAEPLRIQGVYDSVEEELEKVKESLENVGMIPAEDFINRYPHELSGGQRQRVAIAAALALDPEILIADEPVSMLDVSMRGQILKILLELRDKMGITILFITHNLAVARQIADRIAVTYLGKVVETGDATEIIDNPKHPYTRALVSVVPVPDPSADREKILLTGETPNPIKVPSGCRFHPRCPFAKPRCNEVEPELKLQADGRMVACGDEED